jgi:hypothetical protein
MKPRDLRQGPMPFALRYQPDSFAKATRSLACGLPISLAEPLHRIASALMSQFTAQIASLNITVAAPSSATRYAA